MTNKVQKIKEWISKEQDGLMDANGNFDYPEHEGSYNILCNLDACIDSLQEVPVNEDLEEASLRASIIRGQYIPKEYLDEYPYDAYAQSMFKRGAQWQKEQIMKDATDVTVHIDAGGYPYIPKIELYDYDNDVPLAKEWDKYKVVLIKEE